MAISSLPIAPSLSDSEAEFESHAYGLVNGLQTFVNQANALAIDVNSAENQVMAVANFKGLWSTLNSSLNAPASCYYNNRFWQLITSTSDVTEDTPGVSEKWVAIMGITGYLTYEDRSSLRSLSPNDGDLYIVESIGLMRFSFGSCEPDDDETAFQTLMGVWELKCPHWDLIDATMDSKYAYYMSKLVSSPQSFAIANTIQTVSANSIVSFSVTITGASVGDSVIITPPYPANYSQIPIYIIGVVTSPNTVTVFLVNYTASSINVLYNSGNWSLILIKKI